MTLPENERRAWVQTLTEKARSSEKKRAVALWLAIFLGFAGMDRFYLGYAVAGLIKLCTLGGFGLWWLLDIVLLLLGWLPDSDGGILDGRFHR